jgi:hypothetical protein
MLIHLLALSIFKRTYLFGNRNIKQTIDDAIVGYIASLIRQPQGAAGPRKYV